MDISNPFFFYVYIGFRKEHLRVQVSKRGNLLITGERPLDDNRWSRFRKEIKPSKDCKTNEIRAKLAGGILHVALPKQTPSTSKILSSSRNTDESPTLSMPSTALLGLESSSSRLKINIKLAWQVALLLAVLVGFGAYVYKYYQQHVHVES